MRKKDREKWAGVIWASSMEVPEMPESVKFYRIQEYRDAEGVDDARLPFGDPEIFGMDVADTFREAVFDGDRSCHAASVSA